MILFRSVFIHYKTKYLDFIIFHTRRGDCVIVIRRRCKMTYFAETVAAENLLRDNVHRAGTRDGSGVWYYPPTVLDVDGRLWGTVSDHLDRVLENRAAVRRYYGSLQPDAPAPLLLNRAGHVAVIESFAADLLTYYRPLLSVVDGMSADLANQTVVLLTEANVLYNIALAMRP